MNLTNGMTDHGTTLFATDEDASEGGWIGVGFGTDIKNNSVPETTATADMRNTTFKAENGADIELVNGTVITTADQLFGEATDTYGGVGTDTPKPGQISIGLDSDGANDLDKIAYANINAKATLKLVDDKTFNDPSSWTYTDSNNNTTTVTANNFIKLTDKGILETDAAQSLISSADSGTTLVDTKTDTSSMSHTIGSVPENGAFVKATDSSDTGITIDSSTSASSPTSSVAKFNASSLELAKTSNDTTANTVAITGSTVQLGVKDGQLLTVTDGTNTGLTPAKDAEITVTNGGALKLVGDSTNTLAANVTLGTSTTTADGSSFTVTDGTKTVGDITAYNGTTVKVDDGVALTAGTVTANSGSTVTLGRNTSISTDGINLNGSTTGTTLNVLGTLSGQKITANGGDNFATKAIDDTNAFAVQQFLAKRNYEDKFFKYYLAPDTTILLDACVPQPAGDFRPDFLWHCAAAVAQEARTQADEIFQRVGKA